MSSSNCVGSSVEDIQLVSDGERLQGESKHHLDHTAAGGGAEVTRRAEDDSLVVVVTLGESAVHSNTLYFSSSSIDDPRHLQYQESPYSPDSADSSSQDSHDDQSFMLNSHSNHTLDAHLIRIPKRNGDIELIDNSSNEGGDNYSGCVSSEQDDRKHEQDEVKLELSTLVSDSDRLSTSPDSGPVATPTTTIDYTTSLDVLHDTKEGIEELCPVCGDKVSGYHYGLLTCESCKGFFKRTVQNKKVYTCVADRSCQIDKTQRKRCPFCRFQKCLEVGMKLEAVRADRMRGGRNKFGPMYKRDRARKLQIMRHRQMSNPGILTTSRGLPTSSSVGITYSTVYSSSSPIKEEIQSPFLSSSTSSPDSSPAPMQGIVASQLNQSVPSGTTIAVTASGANATIVGSPELSVWVGGIQAAAPGPTVANGGGGGGRLGMNAPVGGGTAAQIAANNSRVPPLVRQLLQQVDDAEWQASLYNLIQTQTYNQCEVDLFELLCKVLDQNLFSQVDWARNSIFFKDLRVDDQMKLLQHSWSDLLILDHLHHRIHNKLQDEMTLPNGQKFDLLLLALLGTRQYADRFHIVLNQMVDMQFDVGDYIALKFIILLNPGEKLQDMRNLNDRRSVVNAHEQVKQGLVDYCHAFHPEEQGRYQKLLQIANELHNISDTGERFLYFKHIHGPAPGQTLLLEMLHTRRR